MTRFFTFFSCLLIVLGSSLAFAADYMEDFEAGTINEEIWWIEGNYEISDGALHMFRGIDDGHNNSWVRLRLSNELIYNFEADIKISSSNDQVVGISLGWWQLTESSWILYSIHLEYVSALEEYQVTFSYESPEGFNELARVELGSGSLDEWHKLSITLLADSTTIAIDGNETNLFNGLVIKPDSVWRGDAYVHGHDSTVNPDYFVDNLVANTRLNPTKFDRVALLSEVRQFDPDRFSFGEDSVWYNGNRHRFMLAYAGTSGEPPVYPVYLDAPIYSDPNNTDALRLNDKPNYTTNTNFSDYGLFPYSGFEMPGSAWENKNYKFFIDANGNGLFDSEETNEDWFIPANSLIEMGPINNVTVIGGIHPTFSWDHLPFADAYLVNFYSIGDTGYPNMSIRLHTSGYIYEPSYTYTGDLFSDGQEYAIFIVAGKAHPFSGTGPSQYWSTPLNRSSYFTKYQATDEILDSVTEWVATGELVGIGEGRSAVGRLGAFENMLQNARDLFIDGDIDGACLQLQDAYKKCDGDPRPPDIVGGDAVEDIKLMIETLMASFECG